LAHGSASLVQFCLPLAAALDLAPGESVQWQLLDRSDLRLKRLAATTALQNGQKVIK
jgi:hypothetical protein